MSKVRVSYLINKKNKDISAKNSVKIGGNNNILDIFDYETEYLEAMDYAENMKKGNKQGGNVKKHKRTIKKQLTKRNKKTKKNKAT